MRDFGRKLSCNPNTFLELSSEDLPLFPGLIYFSSSKISEDSSRQEQCSRELLLCGTENEDLLHAFFICGATREGLAPLGWVQQLVPDTTPENFLQLELRGDLDSELAIPSIIATGL